MTLYDLSVRPLIGWMDNLAHILRCGENHAVEHEIDPDALLQARLYPDMFTLIGQVQVATALVKACPHRLAGKEPPKWDDVENSFEELYARIERAKTELGQYEAQLINARADMEFKVPFGPIERDFTGWSYVHGFILPNVYFHITTSYNILRHNGVGLGKFDFFGGRDNIKS